MTRKDWLLLAIDAAKDDGLDPIQLQKSLFLLGQKRGQQVGPGYYNFEPHNYGPFSKDIYVDVDDLVTKGLVSKTRQTGYAWSVLRITEVGQKRAAVLRGEAPESALSYLDKAVAWVKNTRFDELVRSIYKHFPEYRQNSIFANRRFDVTLIVGILCADGVVVAADGAATFGVMGQQTVRQPIKKLEIISNALIVGVSGPVGLAQRYSGEIQRQWGQGTLQPVAPDQAMVAIRNVLLPHILAELQIAQAAMAVVGQAARINALSGTLVALTLNSGHQLFQFDQQASPEFATSRRGSAARITRPVVHASSSGALPRAVCSWALRFPASLFDSLHTALSFALAPQGAMSLAGYLLLQFRRRCHLSPQGWPSLPSLSSSQSSVRVVT